MVFVSIRIPTTALAPTSAAFCLNGYDYDYDYNYDYNYNYDYDYNYDYNYNDDPDPETKFQNPDGPNTWRMCSSFGLQSGGKEAVGKAW